MGAKSNIVDRLEDEFYSTLKKNEFIKCGVKINYSMIDSLIVDFRDRIGKLNLVRLNGEIYYYVDTHYIRIEPSILEMAVERSLEDLGIHTRLWRSINNRLFGRVRVLMNDDIDRDKISLLNGVLDVSSGSAVLYKHSPEFKTFYVIPYRYKENTKGVVFQKFIERIMPDYNTRKHLQELCGAIFLDRKLYHIEKMGVLYGTGANGKSTFAEVICGVLGRQNVSYYSINALTYDVRRQANIFAINGKLVNWCTDMSPRTISRTETKSLISGEPQIGRELYREPVEITDIPMLFCNVNSMPNVPDPAVARRLSIFPFSVTIPENERDVTLAAKMREEYPAILDWMLDGLRRLRANNYQFTESPIMRDAFLDASVSDDTLSQCLTEQGLYINGDKEIRVPLADIRIMVDNYCDNIGGHKMTAYAIGRKLREAGCHKYRSDGTTGYILYTRNTVE